MTATVRVGTRRSPLARAQTRSVVTRLAAAAPDVRFEAVHVDTSGDRDRRVGGSTDFTDAIDRALARGDVDLAVHSAKDLPATLDRRFALLACPRRADPRDCLVIGRSAGAGRLARGARVGSSSPRRRAQLLRWRPDLEVVEVRGNVDTRLGLARDGTVDAVVLAVAGLARLRRSAAISRRLPTRAFLPAPGQGTLAVLGRSGDADLARAAGEVDHRPTRACLLAERALAAGVGGDCTIPLGALAELTGRSLRLRAELLSPDGRRTLRAVARGPVDAPGPTGARLGRRLLDLGAAAILDRPTG